MRSDNGQKEESTEARNKSMLPSPPAKAGQKKKVHILLSESPCIW